MIVHGRGKKIHNRRFTVCISKGSAQTLCKASRLNTTKVFVHLSPFSKQIWIEMIIKPIRAS